MKIKFNIILLLTITFATITNGQDLKSPSDFLGYEIGTQFSRHYQVLDYFNHIAKSKKNNIILKNYGLTYERRPLFYAVISSENNILNIESIRKSNLSSLDRENKEVNDKSIVWLSYGIHGNESSSTEAAMQTAYELLTERTDLLENTIVIIDPCLNPDGRDRYVNWYNQTKSTPYNNNIESKEHTEPWPNGRSNHYLFDLNRDWAWLTQVESELRIKEYQKWLPHVHVDFHEQGIDEPYYFAPAAEPYHEQITKWQREFQNIVGENNAKYFDKNGWLYFTGEIFDLLYPSYGDTYPSMLGSVGMTYEQAGGGIAGLGVINGSGNNLTLVERVTHHTIAGISTVEISSKYAEKLNIEFKKFFEFDKNNEVNYILSGHQNKIEQLTNFLQKHNIEFYSTKENRINAYSYQKNKNISFETNKKDLVISNSQPRGKMVDILFEQNTNIMDSLTYDISAWSLPYVYGLDAYSTNKKIEKFNYTNTKNKNEVSVNALAYACKWEHLNDATFLSNLIKNNIKVRYSEKIIENSEVTLPRGSLIIYLGEQKIKNYEKTILEIANIHNVKLYPLKSGLSDSGPDLGSADIKLINKKNVAIFSGEDNLNSVSSLKYGSIWYFFEQELKYPLTHINVFEFSDFPLDNYDVLIIPDGYYGSIGESENLDKLLTWIDKGGKVIAFENAIRIFSSTDDFSVKIKNYFDYVEEDINYKDTKRNSIQYSISGAIFKVNIDNTHPTAFGYDKEYYSLKTSSLTFEKLNEGFNVGSISEIETSIIGFVGNKIKRKFDNSMVFGHETYGDGNVIYFVDNIMFRSFWENGKLFLANSTFFMN